MKQVIHASDTPVSSYESSQLCNAADLVVYSSALPVPLTNEAAPFQGNASSLAFVECRDKETKRK